MIVNTSAPARRAGVDLYLGPEVVWVLKAVDPHTIRRVIAHGGPAITHAAQLEIETITGDINSRTFEPASVALSVHYPQRIAPEILSKYRCAYNLHPGFLPWCRGLSPVNWAMWEDAPAGATLHWMNDELDAGNIVDQIRIEYGPDEIWNEVHRRVSTAERELFDRYWPRIAKGEELPAHPQQGPGSRHTHGDTVRLLRRLKQPETWHAMSAPELVKLLRCFGSIELGHGQRSVRVYISPGDQPLPTTE